MAMASLSINLSAKFEVADLRDIVQANRDKHQTVYDEALIGYRVDVSNKLASLQEQNREAVTPKKVRLSLDPPECYVSEYNTVLKMLELTVDDVITLSADEVRCLVEDEWPWSRHWWSSNVPYSSRASAEFDSKYRP